MAFTALMVEKWVRPREEKSKQGRKAQGAREQLRTEQNRNKRRDLTSVSDWESTKKEIKTHKTHSKDSTSESRQAWSEFGREQPVTGVTQIKVTSAKPRIKQEKNLSSVSPTLSVGVCVGGSAHQTEFCFRAFKPFPCPPLHLFAPAPKRTCASMFIKVAVFDTKPH